MQIHLRPNGFKLLTCDRVPVYSFAFYDSKARIFQQNRQVSFEVWRYTVGQEVSVPIQKNRCLFGIKIVICNKLTTILTKYLGNIRKNLHSPANLS